MLRPFNLNTNLKAVGSYYVLTLDGGIFNHFGTQKERNLGLDKVTFSGKSLSPILKLAMRGVPYPKHALFYSIL